MSAAADERFDFERAIDRWQLGFLRAADLPQIAYRALAAGIEAPALYELAGLDRPEMREAGPLFRRALEQLGRFAGNLESDPLGVLALLAERLLAREVDLITGCRQMAGLRVRAGLPLDAELNVFVAIDSDSDELPVGPVRQKWSAEALREADAKIAELEASARDQVDEACRALIARARAPR